MAKTKMKAQIRYHKREDGREGYAINILGHDGEWGMDSWFPLVEIDKVRSEADFVHWSILKKLADLQYMGYEIDLRF